MCFVQPQTWHIFSMASGSVKSKTRGEGGGQTREVNTREIPKYHPSLSFRTGIKW